jgi:sugar lactone lactonase YvrE
MLILSAVLVTALWIFGPVVYALTGDVADVIAGGIPNGADALSSCISNPATVAVTTAGSLLVASSLDSIVLEVRGNSVFPFAGYVRSGNLGNGGPATLAQLSMPVDVVFDKLRQVTYILDGSACVVRKVAAPGNISTYAGTGTCGDTGAGGPATNFAFSNPAAIALDPAANTLYIADTYNNRIRAVLGDGTLMNVVGTGGTSPSLSPDGTNALSVNLKALMSITWAAPLGYLYILTSASGIAGTGSYVLVLYPNGTVFRIAGDGGACTSTGDNGPATDANICAQHITWNNATGALLVTDTFSHRIRQINITTGNISTIASSLTPTVPGAQACSLTYPTSTTAAPDGVLYVAIRSQNRVCRWDPTTNKVMTIAGNGFAGESGNGNLASLSAVYSPAGLVFDADVGKLLFSDKTANAIRSITANGYIDRYAGLGSLSAGSAQNGNATLVRINNPYGMCLEKNGSLLILDTANHVVRRMYRNQTIVTVAGSGTFGFNDDGLLALDTWFSQPQAVIPAVGGWQFVVADTGNHRVRGVGADGRVRTLAGTGFTTAYH